MCMIINLCAINKLCSRYIYIIIILTINFELSMLSGTLARMVAKFNQLMASIDLARVEVAKKVFYIIC